MPRNGSGTMTAAQTYATGQTITAAVINANITDIASELTNSVAKDGQTVMTGPLKASNGTAAAPSITFGSDLDTGIYRKSANKMGVSLGGVEVQGAFMPTGAMMQYLATTAPTGWVRGNGRTIGNASSSATERANADTADLFEFLWENFADGQCAVSTGRGASAAADYAANKTITLPDLRGRAFFGLDDMGATAAARLGTIITDETTNGASGGSERVTLTSAQLAAHTHDLSNHTHTGTTSSENADHTHTFTTASNGAHTHTTTTTNTGFSGPATGGGYTYYAWAGADVTGSNGAHTHTGTTDGRSGNHQHTFTSGAPSNNTSGSAGTGSAHSNMPPAWLGTYIIKL
jgi:microcystin-dependent protein